MKAGWSLGGLLLVLFLQAVGSALAAGELPPDWAGLPEESAGLSDAGARVVLISERFLGIPYQANTLGGGQDQPERLTVRLDSVDCFTLLDYVEALRRSATAAEFPLHLQAVRYRDGVLAWDHRRHFFTDWAAAPEGRIVDVTAEVGGAATRQAAKQLNRGADGALLLPGVAIQDRTVRFIPGTALDSTVLGRLQTGDYVGLYAPAAGLDVSHVGLVVRKEGRLLLRHASSRPTERRVIDSDLAAYFAGKPGLVVLRPR